MLERDFLNGIIATGAERLTDGDIKEYIYNLPTERLEPLSKSIHDKQGEILAESLFKTGKNDYFDLDWRRQFDRLGLAISFVKERMEGINNSVKTIPEGINKQGEERLQKAIELNLIEAGTYKPKVSKTAIAIFVADMNHAGDCTKSNNGKTNWRVFEKLFGMDKLSQAYNKAKNTCPDYDIHKEALFPKMKN